MKNILLTFFLIIGVLQSFAQYSSDRYYPKEVILKLGVDTCRIYNVLGKKRTLKEELVYNSNGQHAITLDHEYKSAVYYFYDASGKQVAEYHEEEDSTLSERDTLIYDASGLLIKRIKYSANHKEATRSEYRYVSNVLSEEDYYFGVKLATATKFGYDEKGRLKSSKTVFNGTVRQEVYIYDTHNNVIGYAYIANKDTLVKQSTEYDAMNRKIKLSTYGEDKMLQQTYIYAYDANGLLKYEEWYTEIENGNIKKSKYTRLEYSYTYHYKK